MSPNLAEEDALKRFLLFGCLAAFLGGCAFGNRTIHLNYLPSSVGGEAQTESSSTQPVIHLVPLADVRSEGKIIGEVVNGYGQHTADVLAANSISDWVTQAAKLELERAGYKIRTDDGSRAAADEWVLSGEVGRVFTTAKMKYEAQVSFAMKLDQNGKELFQKRYMGTAKRGLNWAMTSKSSGEILSAALQDGLQRFIQDLRRVLNGEAVDATSALPSPSGSGVQYV